jgi:WD40 repeat protein
MTPRLRESTFDSAAQTQFKFWAFISYSNRNRKWSQWLHRSIETYRTPRGLVGQPSRDGKVPQRLFPVFRDRDELPSSGSLPDNINEALRQSRYLIVICSPEAAASQWVNKEIVYFKSLGREDRVLCLIIGGEPNATDKPESTLPECFPPAIRFRVDPNGELTGERTEPIAGDARQHGDGKAKAKVKIIAGLLGVNFDNLWQREKRRRFWRRVQAVATAVIMSALVTTAWQWQARVAREERIQHLTDRGLQELSQSHADIALVYLSAAYSAGGNSPALKFLLRRAKLELPNVSSVKGGKEVFCASFSPDDSRVVTASKDNTAKVYDSTTGRLIATLPSLDCVNSAMFSPDGKQIVTSSDDGVARLWDAGATGELSPIAIFNHSPGKKIFPAVFSPNGEWIATGGSEDGFAKIWNAKTKDPRPVAVFTNHVGGRLKQGIDTLRFSRDGTMIVTAGRRDNAARVWDPAIGRELSPPMIVPGNDGLRDAVFSPDGSRVVTCSWIGEASLWSTNGIKIKQLIPPMANGNGNVWTRRAKFSPDGQQIVTTSADGMARVFDGNSGKPLYQPLFHAEPGEDKKVFDAAFSTNGQIIATAGGNNIVKLWDAASGQLLSMLTNHTGWIVGVEFSHDNTRLSTSGYDGRAFIWDVRDPAAPKLITALPGEGLTSIAGDASGTQNATRLLSGHSRYVAAARFSSDSMRVVTIDADGVARIWLTTNGNLIVKLPGNVAFADAAFNPQGNELVTGTEDGRVAVWTISVESQSATDSFETNLFRKVNSVRFGNNSNQIIAAGDDGARNSVRILDLRQGGLVATLDELALAISADNRQILIQENGDDKVAWICGLDGRQGTKLTSKDGGFVCANFSHDGRRVAAATKNGALFVWDQAGHELCRPQKAHVGNDIFCVNFSPDDRYIVTLGSDNKAEVWDARDGHLIGALKTLPGAEPKYIRSVDKDFLPPATAFSADAAFVSTSSFEPLVNIWDLATGNLLARFPGHSGNVTVVAFSPVKNFLLTGALDGTARIWNLNYESDSPEAIASFVHERLRKHLEGEMVVSDK